MKPSEILTRAADLTRPYGAWTQGAYARDLTGSACPTRGKTAACRCAWGAISAASKDATIWDTSKALAFLKTVVGNVPCIEDWNDDPERTQSEVVSALRNAAELAKQQESA